MTQTWQHLREDLIDQKLTDCSFSFKEDGKKKILAAHKTVLASVSTVFKAILYDEAEPSPILIDDISLETFHRLIMIIYGEELQLDEAEAACDLYYAAQKYDVIDALTVAKNFMFSHMNGPNIEAFYRAGKLFEDDELIQKCCEFYFEKIYDTTKIPMFFESVNEPLCELTEEAKAPEVLLTIDDEPTEPAVPKIKEEKMETDEVPAVVENVEEPKQDKTIAEDTEIPEVVEEDKPQEKVQYFENIETDEYKRLKETLETYAEDIKGEESIEKYIGKTLGLVRLLTSVAGKAFGNIVPGNVAELFCSFRLVPPNGDFADLNMLGFDKSFGIVKCKDEKETGKTYYCYGCEAMHENILYVSSKIRDIIAKYPTKDISTYKLADIKAFFKAHEKNLEKLV